MSKEVSSDSPPHDDDLRAESLEPVEAVSVSDDQDETAEVDDSQEPAADEDAEAKPDAKKKRKRSFFADKEMPGLFTVLLAISLLCVVLSCLFLLIELLSYGSFLPYRPNY